MSIYREYTSELERSCDILTMKFDIATDRAFTAYEYAVAMGDVSYDDITLEDGEQASQPKQKSGFAKFVSKIVNYIVTFIKDFIAMLGNMFSRKENLDLETYLASDKGKMEFGYDVLKVEEQVADDVRKGRKLIQLISSKTGVDDATVEEYVDKGARGVMKYGGTALIVAVGYKLYKKGKQSLAQTGEEVKKCADAANAVEGDPKKEGQVKKIFNFMQKRVKDGTEALKGYATKLEGRVKSNKDDKAGKSMDEMMNEIDEVKEVMNLHDKDSKEYKQAKNKYESLMNKVNKTASKNSKSATVSNNSSKSNNVANGTTSYGIAKKPPIIKQSNDLSDDYVAASHRYANAEKGSPEAAKAMNDMQSILNKMTSHIDEANQSKDYDKIVQNSNEVIRAAGKKPIFNNLKEFKQIIKSGKKVKF